MIRHIVFTVPLLTILCTITSAAELKVETIKSGDCSKTAKNGDSLKLHYAGMLDDGTEFDSSYKRGDPFTISLGAGQVIKGWDQGIVGMCLGEKRKLTIPPHLAYGKRGYPGVIPEEATLHFNVELMSIGAGEEQEL